MQTVYEAMNSLEAAMVQHMLDAEGILAHVSGAHLEGGAGDLQAGGVVRVMVDAEDQERAGEIIRRWEQAQPVDEPQAASRRLDSTVALAFVAGIVVGLGLAIVLSAI